MQLYLIRASHHTTDCGVRSFISREVFRTRAEAEPHVEPFRQKLCNPAMNPLPCEPSRTTAWVEEFKLYDAPEPCRDDTFTENGETT